MSNFKIGDIVVIKKYTDAWKGAILVIANIITHGHQTHLHCTLMKASGAKIKTPADKNSQSIGVTTVWFPRYFRLATSMEKATLAPRMIIAKDSACGCSSTKLFNFGCKCGGA